MNPEQGNLPSGLRRSIRRILLFPLKTSAERSGGKVAIAVLPLVAIPSHMHPSLVFRKLIKPRVERELCLITRRDNPLSASAQKIRDLLLTETPRSVDRLNN
ncbi:MAG: hypothetical protein GY802_28200 [Gammaproteobacteria bacterium]|nr:hypothetical protein [Gammaproteobacteria bacterium]